MRESKKLRNETSITNDKNRATDFEVSPAKRRKPEGSPQMNKNVKVKPPQGLLDNLHRMNPEQTRQLPTRSDTHEGINYNSGSQNPAVYTRMTFDDIRSDIRGFFGRYVSQSHREYRNADAEFLYSFCKWNIHKKVMPTDQQVHSFLRDIGIRYDNNRRYSYFSPPEKYNDCAFMVSKNICGKLTGMTIRRDREPSATISTWLHHCPAGDRTIIQTTNQIQLEPLQNTRTRGRVSDSGSRNNTSTNTSNYQKPCDAFDVMKTHRDNVEKEATAVSAKKGDKTLCSDVCPQNERSLPPDARDSVGKKVSSNSKTNSRFDEGILPQTNVASMTTPVPAKFTDMQLGFHNNPTYADLISCTSPPEIPDNLLGSQRHLDIVERKFSFETKFQEYSLEMLEYVKKHLWYETVQRWWKTSNIDLSTSCLPAQYVDSRVPANVNLQRNFAAVGFASEVTFEQGIQETREFNEPMPRTEGGITYVEVLDPIEEEELEYEAFHGCHCEIPEAGKYKACVLEVVELYRICHRLTTYSMFDAGFQNEMLLHKNLVSSVGFNNSFINFCPCSRMVEPFLETHGIHEYINRQLWHQISDVEERKNCFCKNNKFMSNETMFQHLRDKAKTCYIHFLLFTYVDVYYAEITNKYWSNKKQKGKVASPLVFLLTSQVTLTRVLKLNLFFDSFCLGSR